METKKCSKCEKVKLLQDFHKCISTKDGHHTICKVCRNEHILMVSWIKYPHRMQTGNIVKRNEQEKLLKKGEKRCCRCKEIKPLFEFSRGCKRCKKCDYEVCRNFLLTPTGKESNKKRCLKYLKTKHGKLSQKIREKRKYLKNRQNPQKVLNNAMATAIYIALNKNKKGRHWENLVGYKLQDLKEHLEKKFNDKMGWNNYGSYWHVDHIKPKSKFRYNYPEDEEFKECWALKNLQPLEAIENIRKNNKYNE